MDGKQARKRQVQARQAPARQAPARQVQARQAPARQAAAEPPGAAERAGGLLAEWAPTAGGILLGIVLAWFGYHELVRPAPWTGYVPAANPNSGFAAALVLVHGWVLLLLAVALVAGIAPRAAALLAAVLLLEIVISLTVSNGLSDLVLRDVGVLGLAVCLAGCSRRRLVLAR